MQNEISGIDIKKNVDLKKVGEFGDTGQCMNRILYRMSLEHLPI